MSNSVIFRVLEGPFPGLSENSVAIGEVLAIFPDEYMGLEELGFVDRVGVRYGHEGECIAYYEACMTASREATPAEYAALMAGQGPHFSDLEPCGTARKKVKSRVHLTTSAAFTTSSTL